MLVQTAFDSLGASKGYGMETRCYGALDFHDQANDQYFSVALNSYGGKYKQHMWQTGYKKNDFSIKLDEDFPFSDKYRTGAFEIQKGNFTCGLKVFTTDHEQAGGHGGGVRGKSLFSGKRGGFYKNGSVLLGACYVGYNYNGKAYRIGVDVPTGQDIIQN